VRAERHANGVECLVQESHVAPVAEVEVWVRVGSADEAPGELGLAHFHEHMLFKGTPRRPVGAIAAEVEGAGGQINAYTSFDATVYHATVPSDRAALALDVLADAVRHPLFDPEEIRREVEVVLEEIRRSLDDPHQVLGNALFAQAYRRHPYGVPILGTPESVAAFDRDRVRAFFERWYAPPRLFLVVTGDVEAEAVLAQARDLFGDARPLPLERARGAEPPGGAPRRAVLRRPFERASLELAVRTLPLGHPDAPALDLLAFVLGEGESSRLVRRVQEDEGLVDRIEAWSWTPLEPGLFGIAADLDPARLPEALAACARELERLCRERVADDELEKARANLLAGELFERESVAGLARKLGSFHALAGSWRAAAGYLEAVRRATPADLLRVARAHLGAPDLAAAVLLPEGAAPALDADAVGRALETGRDSTRRAFAAPRRSAPQGRAEAYELPGAARLYVLASREVPVVAVRAAFLGGLLAEDAPTAGLTRMLTGLWLRGTASHTAAGFARAVESLAAEIDGFSGRQSFGLGLDCLAERLEPALDLFAEVLLEPAFDPEELERERRETLAALERREDRLDVKVFDLFQEELYAGHPYALPTVGRRESVAAFDAARVDAHHRRWVRAPNLVLAAAGDVDPDALAAALAHRLAALPAGPFEPPEAGAPDLPRTRRERELRKPREQAHLVVGFAGLTIGDPDREALEVATQCLAGQGGRLFLELRDRQGLAYSVSASSVEGLAAGFFAAYIGTAPEKLDRARAAIEAELRRLLEAPPAEAELEAARRHLIGSHAIEAQRAASRALHAALDARYGLGADARERRLARIRAVGPEDVLRVARRVVDLDRAVVAVIRP
jgi:zinc protease